MKKIRIIITFYLYFCVSFTLCGQHMYDANFDEIETLYYDGHYEKSLQKAHEEILRFTPKTSEDSLLVAKLYYLKGASLYSLSQFSTAINTYFDGIIKAPINNDGINFKGKLLYEKALAEHELGLYKESYTSAKAAQRVLNSLEHPNYNYLLSVYTYLAQSARHLGYFDEAENYLKESELVYQNHKDSVIIDKTQASKVVLHQYHYINLYTEKKELLPSDEATLLKHIKVLDSLKQTTTFNAAEKHMYATVMNIIGNFYLNHKDAMHSKEMQEKISDYLSKALMNLDKTIYPDYYLQIRFNQAKAARYAKKYTEALKINREILSQVSNPDYRIPFFIAQRGLVYLDENDVKNALHQFHKMANTIHQDIVPLASDYTNFKPSPTFNHSSLFVDIADEMVQKFPNNPEILEQATKFYNSGLQQFKSCFHSKTFNVKTNTYYHKAIGGILNMKSQGYGNGNEDDTKSLLNTIENIENRLAWQEFIQNRKYTTLKIPDSLRTQERELRYQIAKLKNNNEFVQVYQYQEELDAHLAYVADHYPIHATFANTIFDVSSLQHQIDSKTIILRYKKINNDLYLFGITSTKVFQIPIDEGTEIETKLLAYVNTLKNAKEDKLLASTLFKELLPLDVSPYENMIIVPDGILHQLPFETLRENHQYLISNFNISYAPFLVFINGIQKKRKAETIENDLMVFAPAYVEEPSNQTVVTRNGEYFLRGAQRESSLLTNLFSGRLFRNDNATKSNFIEHAPHTKLIHLSMHAIIDNETPELSYLSFTKSDNADHKMFIEELYGMDLKANLAVLSACNTGNGIDTGRGIVSMHRAFTYAGVPTTVASLWEVPDHATQQIMVLFYKELKTGVSKAEALRNAKKQYLSQIEDAHLSAPFYWAGFVLNGDNTPIVFSNIQNEHSLKICGLIALFILIIILFRIRNHSLKLF